MSEGRAIRRSDGPARKGMLGLRAKMLVYFGLLFVLAISALKWVEFYGIPFTPFDGEYRIWQSEELKQLGLVADLKKERLKRWIKERRDDTKVIADNKMLGTYVVQLHATVQENIESGMGDEELWTAARNERSYQMLMQFLNLIKTTYEVYDNIQIADAATGTVVVSLQEADLGLNISGEDYFIEALRSGEGFINIRECTRTKRIQLFVSQVIKAVEVANSDEDRPYAVIIMHINPDDFITPMLHTGKAFGETGEALLINQDVKILTSLKYPLADGTDAQPLEYEIQAKPAQFAAGGEEGIIMTLDYRGVPVLAAYRHIRISSEMGWGMVVKRDRAEVFAPLRLSLFYSLLVALVSVVAVLCLVYVIASRISRPIRLLSQTVQQVESGDLGARAPAALASAGEIGLLAGAFNSMIQRIQNWYDELDAAVRDRTLELTKLNDELAAEVVERKQAEMERKRLNSALESKNIELEQIVYVTSHDLRSPLVNIQGFSKELEYSIKQVGSTMDREDVSVAVKEELAPVLKEDIPECIRYILTSVAKMDSLLSGLLRLSRLGRAALTLEKLDMNELMSNIVGVFEFQTREANVTVQVNDLPPCQGDTVQINQLFSNLLDNALKYLDPDRAGIISISGWREVDHAVYCVEDNGIGIAPNHSDKIFEIFHRLDPTRGSGEGLGLTIARRILDRHDGRIWVESEQNEGSRFFVSLPGG